MLLAFSASPEELEVLMLSLTFGNVDVQKYVYFLRFFYWMACCPSFVEEELHHWLFFIVTAGYILTFVQLPKEYCHAVPLH